MRRCRGMARLAGVVAVMVIAAPLALHHALAGGDQVPFRGTMTGKLVQTPLNSPATSWSVEITGTGQATHLGRVAVSISNAKIDLGDGTLLPGTPLGVGTFSNTRGDKVAGQYAWVGFPTPTPGVLGFAGAFVITGGEGRFAGATGHGTFYGRGDLATNLVTATFDGTVRAPRQN